MPTLQESNVEPRHLVLPEHTSPIETAHGSDVLISDAEWSASQSTTRVPDLEIETDAGQWLFDEAHNAEGRSK